MSDFHAIGSHRWTEEGNYVKAWEPGDGLKCSAAGHQKSKPCGKPAAVIVTRWTDEWVGKSKRYSRKSNRRVVCADHLAKALQPEMVGSMNAVYEKAASEALIEKYWDEYQGLYKAIREEKLAEAIEPLPEPIKEAVRASLMNGDEYDPREAELNQRLDEIKQELEELKRCKSK